MLKKLPITSGAFSSLTIPAQFTKNRQRIKFSQQQLCQHKHRMGLKLKTTVETIVFL